MREHEQASGQHDLQFVKSLDVAIDNLNQFLYLSHKVFGAATLVLHHTKEALKCFCVNLNAVVDGANLAVFLELFLDGLFVESTNLSFFLVLLNARRLEHEAATEPLNRLQDEHGRYVL